MSQKVHFTTGLGGRIVWSYRETEHPGRFTGLASGDWPASCGLAKGATGSRLKGNAMRLFVSNGFVDLEGHVDDDADLDGTFTLIDDDGESFRVNGWQAVEIEEIV